MTVTLGSDFTPWVLRKPPSPAPPAIEEDNVAIMKKFYVSLGEVKVLAFLCDLALKWNFSFLGHEFHLCHLNREHYFKYFSCGYMLAHSLCIFSPEMQLELFSHVYEGTDTRLKNILSVTWEAR